MLTKDEARDFYNYFGSKQDTQGFYEDRALHDLIDHATFDQAKSIFEFGIGTGKFAEELLANHLPVNCRYSGVDISQTMLDLSTERLQSWSERVEVRLSDGSMQLPAPDGAFDRFVSNYVLDLLDGEDIPRLLEEARRILVQDGMLCLVSLAHGENLFGRGISSAWEFIHKVRPHLVGGCRPIELLDYLSEARWKIEYHHKIVSFGITSGILVARPVV
jgi:ubiquinone/menaquinone biosynthesis C-methylase UbiE